MCHDFVFIGACVPCCHGVLYKECQWNSSQPLRPDTVNIICQVQSRVYLLANTVSVSDSARLCLLWAVFLRWSAAGDEDDGDEEEQAPEQQR